MKNWRKILDIAKETALQDYDESQLIIHDQNLWIKEKVNWLLWLKWNIISKLKFQGDFWFLSESFHVDGGIKLSNEELHTFPVELLESLNSFTYEKWNERVFRNQDYYFLFDSLQVQGIDKFWSINDFHIEDIDVNKFFIDFNNYYESINRALLLALEFALSDKNNESYHKVILWLQDARINVIAFLQNIIEIITDDNFLNSEYNWKLVFNQKQVIEIESFYAQAHQDLIYINDFDSFKSSQKKIMNLAAADSLANSLSREWDNYTKLLLWNTNVLSVMHKELVNWTNYNSMLVINVINTIKVCFDVIKNFDEISWIEPEREKSNYYKLLANKVIRLYREENDPLVMIKTALNSYVWLIKKWFNPEVDNLDIFSVNYGWATIWAYVKPVLDLLFENYGVGINNWNVVYSKYDLQNQNKGLNFYDYPYSAEVKKYGSIFSSQILAILDNDYEKLFWIKKIQSNLNRNTVEGKNYVVIYDDNAQSWTTLKDLKKILEKEWVYETVLTYACRVNPQVWRISQSYSQEEKLELFNWAWVISKRSPLRFLKWTRYNESLSRVTWRRIFKENNK